MSFPATLIGNIVADPELTYGQNGIARASVNLAVNERIYDKQKNEWVDGDTTWVRLTIWREQAEYASSTLTKGMRVIAVGKVKNRPWEDKDGNKRYTTEIVAANMQMLDSKGQGRGQEPAGDERFPSDTGTGVIPEDDVPF